MQVKRPLMARLSNGFLRIYYQFVFSVGETIYVKLYVTGNKIAGQILKLFNLKNAHLTLFFCCRYGNYPSLVKYCFLISYLCSFLFFALKILHVNVLNIVILTKKIEMNIPKLLFFKYNTLFWLM